MIFLFYIEIIGIKWYNIIGIISSCKSGVNAVKKSLLCVLSVLLLTGCMGLRDAGDVTRVINDTESGVHISEFARSYDMTPEPALPAESDEASEPAVRAELDDPYAGVNITFLFAGDNLIHPNIYIDASYRKTAEKAYDFLPMYENIAEAVAAADYAFINQETVMAGEGYANSGYPTFNSPQQLGLDLAKLGFDIIGMANNHMLDKGAAGLSATMDFWDSCPVVTIGAYRDEEDAARLRIVEKDGVKIALLAYTYGTNGIVKPSSSPLVIPYIDDELIKSDIAGAEAEADFIIVSIHWGDENTQKVSSEQKRLAQLIADSGADIIIGHHSHTLQPIETVTAADGREILCVYSLGNLVSGMARPVNQVGGLFTFTVTTDGLGGLCVDKPHFEPTVFYYGMDWYSTKIYYMDQYTEEIAKSHGTAISGYTLTPEQARAFVTGVIGEEYLN